MTIRSYLGAKIPDLTLKTVVTDADMQAVQSTGPIHRWFVGADMAWGALGSVTPATTISGRCAKAVWDAQIQRVYKAIQPWSEVPEWYEVCPPWALGLGAFLEVVDPGHLQGAMDADISRQVAGLYHLTGIRVLAPQEK